MDRSTTKHCCKPGPSSRTYDNICTRSFAKELQSLRRKLESGPDAAAEFSLIALIQALTTCVSSLREGVHDAVLTTILSISLWSCSKVGASAAAATSAFLKQQIATAIAAAAVAE
eukprot:GHRQ01036595.1.p2 GENE.GHRQ01036595.1~~GHRQ01036595.1.p2  ORF type:complete len:115 (-),score=43.76 GHRQ01036595.1:8-352(-)